MAQGTALITGASSGIGAELARMCAGDGFDLILVARRAKRLHELAESFSATHHVRVRVLPADLAEAGAPQSIFDILDGAPPDVLINNAGVAVHGAFAETDWSAQAALLSINLMAPAHLTRLFLPGMLQRGSGRILNVASTAAFVPGPFMASYYASKAFLLSFSEAVANELQGTGVTMTVLCPGPTQSEFFQANGIENSNLIRDGKAMTSEAVAREGYRAMMQGKVEQIAGVRNRWMMRGARLVPRTALAGVTRRLNSAAK